MKYVLIDKRTDYIVQSTRSSMSTEFTQDIYSAALFASEKNAEKALKKMYNKDGSLVADCWYLDLGKGVQPITYWTSAEERDKHADRLAESPLPQLKEQAERVRACEIAGYDLEVRAVKFTIV